MDIGIGLAIGIFGKAINSLITPTKQVRSNQRLSNLQAPKASYGQPIPKIWGRARLGGNLLWASEFQEQAITQTVQGGKNLFSGSGLVTQDRIYFGTAAFGFCRALGSGGSIRIVWANEKLVWNVDSEGADLANGERKFGQFIRLFPDGGDSSLFAINQSLSQNDLGVPGGLSQTETEAYLEMLGVDVEEDSQEHYKDHCYLVLDGLPLSYDYSNTLPTLAALCATENDFSVREIIFEICRMAGYQNEQIDIAGMEQKVIPGFVLDQRKQAGQAIQELYLAQPFDVVSRGDRLIWTDRASGAIWNIPFSDLGTRIVSPGQRSPSDLYSISTVSSENLPQELTLICYDSENYYRESRFTARREILDTEGFENTDETTITAPLVVTPTLGQQIAERLLAEFWEEKTEYSFTLPRSYLAMEPGDFCDVAGVDWGAIKVQEVTYGANLLVQVRAVSFDQEILRPTNLIVANYLQRSSVPVTMAISLPPNSRAVVGVGRSGTSLRYQETTDWIYDSANHQLLIPPFSAISIGEDLNIFYEAEQNQPASDLAITGQGDAEAIALDIPSFNDSDPAYSIYLFATGTSEQWQSASFYGSRDNENFTFLGTHSGRSTIGSAGGEILGGEMVLSLKEFSEPLISVTDEDISGGANKALIGNEIIQFKTATQIGANLWQISDITRGLFGTAQDTVTTGDRFVLLNSTRTRIQASAGDVGSILYFKAVSAYQTVDEVDSFVINYLDNFLVSDKGEEFLSDLGARYTLEGDSLNPTAYQGINQ